MTRWVTLLAVSVTLAATVARAAPPDDRHATVDADVIEWAIPLDDGRFAVRDLAQRLCDEFGVNPGRRLNRLDWSIDLDSIPGRLQLAAIRKATDGLLDTDVESDLLRIRVDRVKLEAMRDDTDAPARRWMARALGVVIDPLHPAPQDFGLFMLDATGARTPIDAVDRLPDTLVILVHGMDDPGWMWRDTIPALHLAGHDVARFEYPNDGPITDATDRLAAVLMTIHSRGVDRIDLVAHSMGGLLARDLLTRTAYYDGHGAGTDALPAVDRLITLGTPNRGSMLVPLRGVSELREHLTRAVQGEPGWANLSRDGRGEAAVDLHPRSSFLRALNRRSLPEHTKITVIAARVSPIDADAAMELTKQVSAMLPEDAGPPWWRALTPKQRGTIGAMFVGRAVKTVGDGIVSLDSARLSGVKDFHVVYANHLTMVVNMRRKSPRIPPALPIILERLAEPRDGV